MLATGKKGGVSVLLVVKADLVQQGLGLFDRFMPPDAENVNGRLDDIFKNRAMGPEIEILEYHTKPGAQFFHLPPAFRHDLAVAASLRGDLLAFDDDAAAIRCFEKIDAAQESALAGTGRADDRYDIALVGFQRNALQNFMRAEALVDVIRFERAGACICHRLTLPIRFLQYRLGYRRNACAP